MILDRGEERWGYGDSNNKKLSKKYFSLRPFLRRYSHKKRKNRHYDRRGKKVSLYFVYFVLLKERREELKERERERESRDFHPNFKFSYIE
jgi:hypothetical protein